jgi:nucleoside-diphosphate-sugar epimerase
MQRILVTGCAGFIGSHVCEKLLKQGCQVIGVDNFDDFYPKEVKLSSLQSLLSDSKFSFLEFDIANKEEFKRIESKIDVVIHLAAKAGVLPSLNNPQAYINTNIIGTNNILNFMLDQKISKLLFASSSSVYGNNKTIPFSEEHFVNQPISPYAFTKRSCELMNYNYHHLYNLDIINLRFFTVYGPRQRPDLAIHKFFNLISENKAIQMYGDGSTARDYTFVDDTVSGILGALEYINTHENVYEIVNLGNNTPVKLSDLIAKIYEVSGKVSNVEVQAMKPGDVDITFADISKATKLFNYNPKTSLDEGLAKFKVWHEQSKSEA